MSSWPPEHIDIRHLLADAAPHLSSPTDITTSLSRKEFNAMLILHHVGSALSLVACALSIRSMFVQQPGVVRGRLMDRLVLILFVLDFVEAATQLMSLLSVRYHGACVVQGTLQVLVVNSLLLWNVVIAGYSMVLVKTDRARMRWFEKTVYGMLLLVLGISGAAAVVSVNKGILGFTFFCCFIGKQFNRQLLLYYFIPMGMVWVLDVAVSVRLVVLLKKHLRGVDGRQSVISRLQRQALLYTTVFIGFYASAFVVRFMLFLQGGVPDVMLFFFSVNWALGGVYDAVVYGRLLMWSRVRRPVLRSSRYGISSTTNADVKQLGIATDVGSSKAEQRLSLPDFEDTDPSSTSYDTSSSAARATFAPIAPAKKPAFPPITGDGSTFGPIRSTFGPIAGGPADTKLEVAESSGGVSHDEPQLKAYGIFATTYNCNGKPIDPALLPYWLPPMGRYHVIAVATQECMDHKEFRAAVTDYLGGPEAYVMYAESMAARTSCLYHNGEVGITVWVRATEVRKGLVQPLTSTCNQVHTGHNLVVTRVGNKGAVGQGFRFSRDTTLAFVACHLAADKQGTCLGNTTCKHDPQIAATLSDVVLGLQHTGFDVHNQQHHLVLLGDLNYRVRGMDASTCLRAISEDGARMEPGWRHAAYRPLLEGKWRDVRRTRFHARAAFAHDVVEADELTKAMSTEGALHGYREQVIAFPPTYRLHPGRFLGDYDDIMTLGLGYGVLTSSSPEDVRVPSYTDRILVHSLDGRQEQMVLGAYESCEAIATSHHRPVSLQMQLLVHEDDEGIGDEALTAQEEDDDDDEDGEWPVRLTLEGMKWTPLDRGTCDARSTARQVAWVTLLFPLPVEDKKNHVKVLSHISTTLDRVYASCATVPPSQVTCAWDQGHRLVVRTVVYPSMGIHAAIKLEDAALDTIAQGTLSLEDATKIWEQGARNMRTPFSVPMCRSGALQGHLTGTMALKTRSKPLLGLRLFRTRTSLLSSSSLTAVTSSSHTTAMTSLSHPAVTSSASGGVSGDQPRGYGGGTQRGVMDRGGLQLLRGNKPQTTHATHTEGATASASERSSSSGNRGVRRTVASLPLGGEAKRPSRRGREKRSSSSSSSCSSMKEEPPPPTATNATLQDEQGDIWAQVRADEETGA